MRTVFVGLVLWLLVAAFTVRSGFAADFLLFSEFFKEKVVCSTEEGELFCDVVGSGRFKINAKVSLTGIDITQFDQETTFSIDFSAFDFSGSLGDDPKYTPGKKGARFVLSEELSDEDEGGKVIRYLTVRLKWNQKRLTIRISGKTPDFQEPILADSHLGEETGPIEPFTEDSSVDFADVSAQFEVAVTGNVSTKTVTKGGEEFEVSKVKLKGKGN